MTSTLASLPNSAPAPDHDAQSKLWFPDRVLFTPAALAEPWGQQILDRVQSFNLPITELKSDRLTGLRGDDQRQTYRLAKRTLAVVTAPPNQFKLSPIPPSADWQFHLAQGCPAHCQYCYLAGSLQGPPVIRTYANLPQILANLISYRRSPTTSYEVSCYTDPLAIEHLTGSLAECIRFFGQGETGLLRWVSKFAAIESLLDLPHHGHTRCRMSVNATPISRQLEGGTAAVQARLQALRRLALPVDQGGGSYPIGLVIAPIMPIPDWQEHYRNLFDAIATRLDFDCDLTFELITHRFTPGSKEVLSTWYPGSSLEMDEAQRSLKRNKFGGIKYVYDRDTMQSLKRFFYQELKHRFPQARILYWT
uniref:Spore photoproduct lyase n=1 Tax=Cyanothece sp. (strain PCC 7425 / ATCC 29141) TaxID=395961 RepID=B8HP31_CYAP4